MSSFSWRTSLVTGAFWGVAALAASVAVPAHAATIVMGDNMGNACFTAVDAGRANESIDELCTDALGDEMLGKRDTAATYVNRGIVRLRLGRSEDALADFNAALATSPSMGDAYTNRAAAHVALGDLATALDDLNTALSMKLEKPEVAYFGRAMVLERLDRVTEAYRDLKQAAALAPDWEAPRFELTRYTVVRN